MSHVEPVLEIDLTANAAYLQLTDEEVARTVEVTPEIQVDLDRLGVATGVEILDLNQPVPVETISKQCHIRSDQLSALAWLRGTVNDKIVLSAAQGYTTYVETNSRFEYC